MAQPGSAAAFGQKALMARHCTDAEADLSNQLIGTVTDPGGAGAGGRAGADGSGTGIGWYSGRRTSGGAGCESGTGSGEMEGRSVTVLQLYPSRSVPPEGEGRTELRTRQNQPFVPVILTHCLRSTSKHKVRQRRDRAVDRTERPTEPPLS